MAIKWATPEGDLSVGLEVRTGTITSATTSTVLYIDVWVRAYTAFADNQTVALRGDASEDYAYFLDTPNNVTTDRKLGTVTKTGIPLSYAGGPTYTFTASLSGAHTGGTPSVTASFVLPARPAGSPASVGTLTVSSVTASEATVSWATPTANGSAITSYQLQVDETSGFSSPATRTVTASPATLTSLTRSITHYVRVRAGNAVGWGGWSPTKSFTTAALAPGAPTGLTAQSVAVDTARLVWTAPADNGGAAITQYELSLAENSAFTGATTLTSTTPAKDLSGLKPGVAYWAKVRAVNTAGASPYSSTTSFTTLSGARVKVAGTWKTAKVYVKVSGSWLPARVWKKHNGAWTL